jgi:6-phosphofructo-2-kinase / fructose-2,6-biphosphatase 2
LSSNTEGLKVKRYLGWISVKAEIFNVGKYRRKENAQPDASFFEPQNAQGEKARRAAAEAAVADLLNWFQADKNNTVAILDATNSTRDRRKWVHERITAAGIDVIFVESKCDDEKIIMSNILEVKTTSPDYKGQDPEEAARDFRKRISNYEKVYETIDENEKGYAYVKLINVGHQVIINLIQDYLSSRLVYYLINLHIKPRHIWLSRVGISFTSNIVPHTNRRLAWRIGIQLGGQDRRGCKFIAAGRTLCTSSA